MIEAFKQEMNKSLKRNSANFEKLEIQNSVAEHSHKTQEQSPVLKQKTTGRMVKMVNFVIYINN